MDHGGHFFLIRDIDGPDMRPRRVQINPWSHTSEAAFGRYGTCASTLARPLIMYGNSFAHIGPEPNSPKFWIASESSHGAHAA